MLTERGNALRRTVEDGIPRPCGRPRILVQKPLPGFVCPLRPCDVRDLLRRLGPSAAYGLRVIRLRQECLFSSAGIVFAEYVVPGEIHVYAVPASPWRLSFIPCDNDKEAFARHGVRLSVDTVRHQTTVEWTAENLTAFFQYEVLAHEIGHHVLQHHKGKRLAQTCRRADHEARADLHSRRANRLGVDDRE